MQCPACSKPFQVAPETAGQTVECPGCKSQVAIPDGPEQTQPDTSMPDPVVHYCPECAGAFGVTLEMQGKRIACPHCDKEVTIEIEDSEPDRLADEQQDDLFAPGFVPPSDSPEPPPLPESTCGNPTEETKEKKKQKSGRFKGGSIPPIAGTSGQPIGGLPPTSGGENAPRIEPDETDNAAAANNPSGLPTLHTDRENAGQQQDPQSESSVDEPATQTTGSLPAPFLVDDPQRMGAMVNRDNPKILLPDATDGTRQLDRRLVKIEYKGQTVELVSRTPEEQTRYRNIVNIISMLLGLVFIFIAFIILIW